MKTKAKGKMSKLPIIFTIIILFILALVFVKNHRFDTKENSTITPTKTADNPLLVDAAVWYPQAPWSEPAPATNETAYGTLMGESTKATIMSDKPTLDHFEMAEELKKQGYLQDNNLSADGPGSSSWGYKKEDSGKSHILLFSYETVPSSSNPNEPLEFNCPCKMNITVFASNSF